MTDHNPLRDCQDWAEALSSDLARLRGQVAVLVELADGQPGDAVTVSRDVLDQLAKAAGL